MSLFFHIVVALAGIGCATISYFRPSKKTLRISYSLVGLTFVSGFYLVWTAPAHMLQACLSGLAYLAVVTLMLAMARQKMIVEKQAN